jgi:hypothetical protein
MDRSMRRLGSRSMIVLCPGTHCSYIQYVFQRKKLQLMVPKALHALQRTIDEPDIEELIEGIY